jgi:hypothetical protein
MIIKTLIKTGALFLAVSHQNMVMAHELSSALVENVGATAYYTVTCGTGTTKLVSSIKSGTPGASVSLQLQKLLKAGNTSDVTGGDLTYSPELTLSFKGTSGKGAYNMLIDKTSSGPVTYSIQYHCMSGDNIHKGTTIKTNQKN